MLRNLSIKNFTILRDVELDFKSGLTVITGETGAGKSMIIKAIEFLCGSGHAHKNIRDDEVDMSVTAEFETSEDEKIICQRVISKKGRTRCSIGGEHVPQKSLFQVTSKLLDVTSQRAFSHLLNPEMDLYFFDLFCGTIDNMNRLKVIFNKHLRLKKDINIAKVGIEDFRHRQELYTFQLNQIDEVDPQIGEDVELDASIKRLENFEELYTNGKSIVDLLIDDEHSVDTALAAVERNLQRIIEIDTKLNDLSDDLISSRSVIKEIASRIGEHCLRDDFDPARLEQMRERQHAILSLVRKYGGSYAALLERRKLLREELNASERHDIELKRLKEKEKLIIEEWIKIANIVSKARKHNLSRFEKQVNLSLIELGIQNPKFELNIKELRNADELLENDNSHFQLDSRGSETVEFLFSANPGIAPKSLAKVASGGELSRLLLAVKESLPLENREASLFLDEIDSGVSGRVAHLVGKKLSSLSQERQMIVITHLPQIAGQADNHLQVTKSEHQDSTFTDVVELDSVGREEAVARMISGGELTSAAIEQASHLINQSRSKENG